MIRDSRKIAAILAADVVEYSRLMGADEAGTLAALAIRRRFFDTFVGEFGGRVFGSVGDSLMAEFPSAVHAVECAQAIQDCIASENTSLPADRRMWLRIGVNLGDVIDAGGLAAGDAVNVAARLQALAKPGGILISGAVYEQVHHKMPARFIDTGLRPLKNILEPVRAWEVLHAVAPGIGGRIVAACSRIASRRVVRAAAVGVALAIAVSLGLFWRDIPVNLSGQRLGALLDPSSGAPPNSIAVLPFLNMSGDSQDDYLGDGIAEELAHRLAKIPGLYVAARTSTLAVRGQALAVNEIADRLGVSYVVEGSVKRQADRVRVNAALVEATSGTSRWSNSYEATSGDFFTIERDIGNQVMTALQLVLGTEVAAAESTPRPQGSVAAYDFFLQGLSYLRQPKSAKTLDAAEQLFGRALAEQPDFARAQAGLCETQVERYALERVPGLVAAAEETCARARALDSTAQEVHMAVGGLRLATGDNAEAEASYRQAVSIVPKSPDALVGLASALAAGGKTEEAERTYGRALAAQPRYAAAHLAYGNFLALNGRQADAIPVYERATVLAPDNPNAFNNLGSAYLHIGELEKAVAAFERSLAIEPRRASYNNSGTVYYYLGQQQKAAEMFRKAIELAPADHRLWGNLADSLYYDARADEAMKTYRRALELAEGELEINPKHAINQAQAAYYASRLGSDERARRSIAVALAEGDDSFYVHYYVGLAELGLGNRAQAVTHIRRARQLGFPESLFKTAPELGDIRTMI